MAVTITVEKVKAGYSTEVPDAEITLLIAIVDEANTCLDANSVSNEKQEILKIYAVRHMLALMENDGRGKAASESAPSGASRSFSAWSGKDLGATRYGALLKQLDVHGCVRAVIENSANVTFLSVGREACDDE